MAGKRKRKDESARPKIHPRNKYCESPPDFGLLSSLYPSFQPYVFYSNDGRPKIDWTDFNATRELTRVLLLHDHNIDWWIPDGQLCPTVPNRSNYIHWIEDLLASDITIPVSKGEVIRGFDIGTGANCIYPLLGASLLGWKFVGSDITDVATEWAYRNVKSNPHISDLIEIRRVSIGDNTFHEEELEKKEGEVIYEASGSKAFIPELPTDSGMKKVYDCPPVLLGVVQDGETFDFCMCNPPFFETIEQAGLNPKTSCGGTPEEMVCRGGERVFITRIIEDSVKLKQAFRWYTSMVGRKFNLHILVSQLWKVGATVVKTTEFVQGRTSRWGLAWSFVPTSKKISSHIIHGNNMSFMLQGLQRQHSAFDVLQSVVAYFASCGASCKLDTASFSTNITMSSDQISATLENGTADESGIDCSHSELDRSKSSNGYGAQLNDLCFRVLVFQQIPGSLLVKGTLLEKESSNSGLFPLIFRQLEEHLNNTFSTVRTITGDSSSKLGKSKVHIEMHTNVH